ncbi:ATP-dependent helicase, partial [Patescibacteria group bacterium]|nr:ATP-dependent helicase [Patescibacteria group bacterium]
QQLIESLPNNSVLRPWGDHFFYQRSIISNIQTLKRENISPQKLKKLIQSQQNFLKNSDLQYQKLKSLRASKTLESELLQVINSILKINLSKPLSALFIFNKQLYKNDFYVSGPAKNPAVNFKNALIKIFDNLKKQIPKQLELLIIYKKYQKKLKQIGGYDFDDMILFVLNKFKKDKDFLLSYQEQFQYILVDEYQDTNSSQDQILELLSSYFDTPNLFIVGDDDQSIFRFQGACLENLLNFYNKYRTNLTLIILKNNYRSHQLILDSSTSVIDNNQNRIANFIKNIDKSLISKKDYDPDPINLFAANSDLEENYFILNKIQKLIKSKVKPDQIAVLYRNNADSKNLSELLNQAKVPHTVSSGTNLLDSQEIVWILNLFQYISNPANDTLLFHLLNFDFLKIDAFDLIKIFRFSYSQRLFLPDLISNSKKLKKIIPLLKEDTIKKLIKFSKRLAKSQKLSHNISLDRFFIKTLNNFSLLKYFFSKNNRFQLLQNINVLYNSVKKHINKEQYPSLASFLQKIESYQENNINISSGTESTNENDSVKLMTVHKAKGLEFEHVFLYKCLDTKWSNFRNSNFLPLPLGIFKNELTTATAVDNEDERRLFYVALTRAKKQIYISYSQKSDTDRNQLPSQFISEINPKLIEKVSLPKNSYQDSLSLLFTPNPRQLEMATESQNYLKNYLKNNYKFNITHLNSYLRCPFCFYCNTVLRIPMAKNKHMSFGTAIHASLAYLYQSPQEPLSQVLNAFSLSLKKENLPEQEHRESLQKGKQALTDYYNFYSPNINSNCLVEHSFSRYNIHLSDIPITGKIDKIEILDSKKGDLTNVKVVDFKTGNPDSYLYKDDYFRQLVFYKVLIDNAFSLKYNVSSGIIDYVQKSKKTDKFVKKEFKTTTKDVDELIKLIKQTHAKILSLDFFTINPKCKDKQKLHKLLK